MEGERRSVNSELWHACAGPRVSLPCVGNLVVYFPQGHSEQVAASTLKQVDGHIPNYPNLPSQLVCQLHSVTLHADIETDEVFAQMTLQPVNDQEKELFIPPDVGVQNRQPTDFFCKTLTASDTSTHGGFSVPRRAAEKVFPPLDFSKQPPAQELRAKDLHDHVWTFRHIYRGQPKRHLLTTGWSVFVSTKRLVAGDSVLFIRDDKGQLLLGIRRANGRQPSVLPSSVLSSDSMHIGVLAAAAHASATSTHFQAFYNPRTSPSEFVIPWTKYRKAVHFTQVSVGMRFRMVFETEESTVRRYMGTVTAIGDLDGIRWPGSKWRNLEVGWDESSAGDRPRRVSLWEIEPVSTPFFICPPFMLRPSKRPLLQPSPGAVPEPDMIDLDGAMKRYLTWLGGCSGGDNVNGNSSNGGRVDVAAALQLQGVMMNGDTSSPLLQHSQQQQRAPEAMMMMMTKPGGSVGYNMAAAAAALQDCSRAATMDATKLVFLQQQQQQLQQHGYASASSSSWPHANHSSTIHQQLQSIQQRVAESVPPSMAASAAQYPPAAFPTTTTAPMPQLQQSTLPSSNNSALSHMHHLQQYAAAGPASAAQLPSPTPAVLSQAPTSAQVVPMSFQMSGTSPAAPAASTQQQQLAAPIAEVMAAAAAAPLQLQAPTSSRPAMVPVKPSCSSDHSDQTTAQAMGIVQQRINFKAEEESQLLNNMVRMDPNGAAGAGGIIMAGRAPPAGAAAAPLPPPPSLPLRGQHQSQLQLLAQQLHSPNLASAAVQPHYHHQQQLAAPPLLPTIPSSPLHQSYQQARLLSPPPPPQNSLHSHPMVLQSQLQMQQNPHHQNLIMPSLLQQPGSLQQSPLHSRSQQLTPPPPPPPPPEYLPSSSSSQQQQAAQSSSSSMQAGAAANYELLSNLQESASLMHLLRESTAQCESPLLSNIQQIGGSCGSDTSSVTSCSYSFPTTESLDNSLILPAAATTFQQAAARFTGGGTSRGGGGRHRVSDAIMCSFSASPGSFSASPSNTEGGSSSRLLAAANGLLDEAVLQRSCSGWLQATAADPLRTFTKVHKSGCVGRSIDLSRLKNYDELRRELARMFNIEGQLEDPQRSYWQLVFLDTEGDILWVGDEPWEEFVNCIRVIKIWSRAQVQQMNLEGLEQLSAPLLPMQMQQTSSSSEDCQVWKGP